MPGWAINDFPLRFAIESAVAEQRRSYERNREKEPLPTAYSSRVGRSISEFVASCGGLPSKSTL